VYHTPPTPWLDQKRKSHWQSPVAFQVALVLELCSYCGSSGSGTPSESLEERMALIPRSGEDDERTIVMELINDIVGAGC